MPINDSNETSVRDNALVELVGADGTPIGNTGDRLKVDANVSSGVSATWKMPLIYEDMIANSGVARDTVITSATWVDVYNYSGAGKLAGFIITLETSETDWQIRLVIDGTDLLVGSSGIFTEELEKKDRYGFDSDTSRNMQDALGLNFRNDSIRLTFPYFPLSFSSTVSIQIKRVTGAATKKFKSGLVLIQKGI